jgi:hypothetical protein
MDKETKHRAYTLAKRRILKALPGATTVANERAGYYVADAEGRNLVALRYPNLAFSDDLMGAWINLDIVSQWVKTEKRNNYNFRNDKQSVAVQGDWHDSSKRITDYVEHTSNWTTSDGQPEI